MLTPVAVALLIALAELVWPARAPVRTRWAINIALGIGNLLLLRLLSVAGPFAFALAAQHIGFGLFNVITVPPIVTFVGVIIAMDLAIYWQHRASHQFGWFWALHRLHHADPDFDVTTGVRFHPGEAVVSMLYKGVCGALLGAPPEAMLLFELYLAVGSLTEHANLRMQPRIDRAIRLFWVTPAMHIIHHSATGDDHNHNFSFAISVWDRLFGTLRGDASGRTIGLPKS